ncbi:hypothetical protein GGS26DRAFT_585938 [Hypomontagnella submonticulosa]|nr:hypothetical protein GGS26DRAFT_585938 [Hypomontagnella submonticulosa]
MPPTLIFTVSVFGYTAKADMDKNCGENIFSGLKDEKRTNVGQRRIMGYDQRMNPLDSFYQKSAPYANLQLYAPWNVQA